MYYEIHKLKREGFKPVQIGRRLVMDYRTVKKYLNMNEEEYIEYAKGQANRKKLLDKYEDFVKNRLEKCEDASTAQIHDWLKENFEDFDDVNEKTVFNFVLSIRQKYDIPKPFNHRQYEQIEELPYGKQAQVDFGEYNMTTEEGKRKKIYFLSMVLSRSRQKYVYFRNRPFTTLSVIDAHEKCFEYFGGTPEQLVYDQDTLLLVSENHGELLLTEQFRQYTRHREFKLHFCRKSDPESKGKVENVIKYIKYNFLRGRIYINIDCLNGQGVAWLSRTGNSKLHSTTKKIPQKEWETEKQYLKTINKLFIPEANIKAYTVRKDNTIWYKSNFYGLPLDTYHGPETTVRMKKVNENIILYDNYNSKIVEYKVHCGRGKLITNNNFKRDYSIGIDQLISGLSEIFSCPKMATEYFQEVRINNPRYIRDQLQLIRKVAGMYDIEIINQAIIYCKENKILKATDFESVVKMKNAEINNTDPSQEQIVVKTMDKSSFRITPQKSNISDYQNLMN